MTYEDDIGTCMAAKAWGESCELDAECPALAACHARVCAMVDSSVCEGMAGAGGAGGQSGAAGAGGFDHGAVSDVYPAPHPPLPQATKGAGSVMKAPVVVPVFFPGDSEQSLYSDFLTKLFGGTYFSVTTSEYGVAPPVLYSTVTLSDAAPATITDLQIRQLLASHVDGSDPAFVPPSGDPLYAVFFPAGTSINLPGAGMSCDLFGGYHDSFVLPSGKSISYAVLPTCGGIDTDTPAVTHELVEAFTDPDTGFLAWSGMEDSHVLWGFDGGEELGDLCEIFKSSTKTDPASGRLIQATWSNASAAASHAPCVPWVGPFFAAAPVMNDDIPIAVLGVTTKGLRIPIGETRVVEVDLFSDGPTNGDFTLSVLDDSAASGGPTYLDVSLDKASGQNGEKVALTIKVNDFDPMGFDRFYVRAELNGERMSWLGVVGP
jgi:hypothetical protein